MRGTFLTFPERDLILAAMIPARVQGLIGLGLLCLCAQPLRASAASSAPLFDLLRHNILASNQPMAEVQAYTEHRVPLMPTVTKVGEWERLARKMRRDALDKVVFRGKAADWRDAKARVVWLETIPGGEGYQLRKLRYEALPGLWIPALLYQPTALSGRVSVVLNVNGHEGIGKSVPYKQIRCINLAKRGMLVLNPEWLGMGQLNGADYQHYKMNQLDLCGSSGVAPFFLAMSRGIDLLLAHPNADPERVAVSGLSGGGWQTIFISSLDPRVTLCNPVAGYSSFRTRARYLSDLGDSEQTPSDLATVVDYAHLTAMLAPRPALLTFNAKDNCCFASPHAMDPLLGAAQPIYRLHGKAGHLRAHVNYDPGDHNFGVDNRQAFYRMVGDFFFPDETAFNATEIPCEAEVQAHTNLLVELPPGNATFNSLARSLMQDLPHQPKLPKRKSAALRWQNSNRARLRELVRFTNSTLRAEMAGAVTNNGTRAIYWKLRLDDAWTVPAVELTRGEPSGTTLVFSDGGRTNAAAEVERLLAHGQRVVAFDPFFFGESRIRSHDFLFALLVAAVGERPIGIQAGQVAAVARWTLGQHGHAPILVALGPRSSLFGLMAAALEEKAIAGIELNGSLGSLKEIIEQNWAVNQKPELFCFGLLEAFDMKHLAALVTPRPVRLNTPSERAQSEFADLKEWEAALGGR